MLVDQPGQKQVAPPVGPVNLGDTGVANRPLGCETGCLFGASIGRRSGDEVVPFERVALLRGQRCPSRLLCALMSSIAIV
jgi:hypothetical protein